MRIRHKTHIRHEVRVHRYTVFESEADHVERQHDRALLVKQVMHRTAQIMNIHGRGVQREISALTESFSQRALGLDPVNDAATTLQRMRTASLFKATHQRRIVTINEQHLIFDAVSIHLGERACEVFQDLLGTDVNPNRDPELLATRFGQDIHERLQHLGRQVIDDIPPHVFQGVARRRTACAGHAGHDNNRVLLRNLSWLLNLHNLRLPNHRA